MKYLGNQPHYNLAELSRWDFISDTDPTVEENPDTIPVNWLRTDTGE